ncbi:MAG TPA: hypothetical protein VIG99_10860 [Myxococcaceae bacterium]|jgi:hypothetical protein
MTKLLLGCAVLVLSVGCATAPLNKRTEVKVVEMSELDATATSPDKTYICEEGHKPGSNLKAPVCQTVRNLEIERVATQDMLHRLMQSGYRH